MLSDPVLTPIRHGDGEIVSSIISFELFRRHAGALRGGNSRRRESATGKCEGWEQARATKNTHHGVPEADEKQSRKPVAPSQVP